MTARDEMDAKSMRELVELLDIPADTERAHQALLGRVGQFELILETRRRFNMSDPWGIDPLVNGKREAS